MIYMGTSSGYPANIHRTDFKIRPLFPWICACFLLILLFLDAKHPNIHQLRNSLHYIRFSNCCKSRPTCHKSRQPCCISRLCPRMNLDLQQGGFDLQQVGKIFPEGQKNVRPFSYIKCSNWLSSFLIYHYLSRKKMVTSLFLFRRQYRFVARRSRFVAGRKIKIKLGLKLANLLKSHIPSLGGIKFIAWTVMFVYKIFLRRSKRKLDAAISVKNYLKANVA